MLIRSNLSVPFIGCVATAQGLCSDLAKVKAITELPSLKDAKDVQRSLGLAQYFTKFLPHLANITKPLQELTQKDVAWTWDHNQQAALDASQAGLGAATLQNSQPIAHVSRALTEAETRYGTAQM